MKQDTFAPITSLLQVALDPLSSVAARSEACDRLRTVPGSVLRGFSSSPEGRALGLALGSSPLSVKADNAESEATDYELPSFAYDIGSLSNDDWTAHALVPDERMDSLARPSERIARCARTRGRSEVSARMYVRQVPWVLLDHGAALIVHADAFQQRPPLLEAFWNECIERSPHLGTPRRLAEYLDRTLSESESRRAWFDRMAEWIDERLSQLVFPFVEVGHLKEIHFCVRAGVAGWVRRAEMTDPRFVAGVEIYATTRLLRHAAQHDLVTAWNESGGDAQAATRLWARHNNEGDSLRISAVESLFAPVDARTSRDVSRFDRQSLALVRQLWLRTPELVSGGLLKAG